MDEAGPLEFEAGRGMTACFRELESADYRLAVVVGRPSCLERLPRSWARAETIAIRSPEQAISLASRMFEEFQRCMAAGAGDDAAKRGSPAR